MKKLLVLGAALALLAGATDLSAQTRTGRAATRGASVGSGTTALWVGGVAVVAAGLGAWGISSMSNGINNGHS